MASVNDSIANWSVVNVGAFISKHEIIRYHGYFWYSLQDHEKDLSNEPDSADGAVYWGGITTLQNGTKSPLFIWNPSYTSAIQHKPDVKPIRFGNGYEQRISQSLNPDLKTFQFNFDQRTEQEARAILHFLIDKSAKKSFAYNPPNIYAETTYKTRYLCREWETNFVFKDNYAIKAKFEEISG